ncbi:hypothetical protein JTB14_007767 [Gonioctena quinquepunctata]|nr:hypothetical protein JTB14_007767 [Gonioctena quinquepunctata]
MISKIFLLAALATISQAGVSPAGPVLSKVSEETVDTASQYSYAYDVQDALTGDSKTHQESRNGDIVQGQYSLNDPDGTRRIVDYTADPVNGFRAVVRKTPQVAVAAPVVEPVVAAPNAAESFVARNVAAPLVARAITAPLLPRGSSKLTAQSQDVEIIDDPAPVATAPVAPVDPVARIARISAPLLSAPYVAAPGLAYSRLSLPFTYSTFTVL